MASLSLSESPSRISLFARLGSKFRSSISFLSSIISFWWSYFRLLISISRDYMSPLYFYKPSTNKSTTNSNPTSKPTTSRVRSPFSAINGAGCFSTFRGWTFLGFSSSVIALFYSLDAETTYPIFSRASLLYLSITTHKSSLTFSMRLI